jgi:Fe-S-cluster containining protein
MSQRPQISVGPLEGDPDPEGGDCVACGRCCHHGPRTVHLLEDDERRMGQALLERFTKLEARPPGFRFLENDGARCAALDVSIPGRFPCRVYDVRPDDCRLVEPGSPCCLEARRLGRLGTSVEFKRRPT